MTRRYGKCMGHLSIDIETYSGTNLLNSGVYRYVEDSNFTVLMMAYAFDDGDVTIVDMAQGEKIPQEVLQALTDENIIKHAFNATFERICLNKYLNTYLPIEQWHCTRVHALMAGLPGRLDAVGKALGLEEEEQKSTKGKALIKYFSEPCKPTKVNGGRTRNLPEHAPEKWEEFKKYCMQDVVAERAIKEKISKMYKITDEEVELYILDQKINDRGIKLNKELIENAIKCNEINFTKLFERAREITGLENPNSTAQIRKWIETHEGIEVPSINKTELPNILSMCKLKETKELINIRKEMSKTSVKKYISMDSCICKDNRARGVLQYYGANRTGRWAGKLIQVHNLPQNKMEELDEARSFLLKGDYEALEILYPSTSNVLSQLIRTTFIPKDGYKFLISDFSAIEARVIAWLSGEQWRLDVFNSHGKIYEASASEMFKVPIESIGKGSSLRAKGKVAELALGYQGGAGALIAMGGLDMGLAEEELNSLVDKWRSANPNIVKLWKTVDLAGLKAVEDKTVIKIKNNVRFIYGKGHLFIELPSGRKLTYLNAQISNGAKFGNKVIKYKGINQTTNQFTYIETYGGKLVENIVQAIARDCLAVALKRLDRAGFKIVMHVHDEVVIEVPKDSNYLDKVNEIMSTPIEWARGLPLKGDSFEAKYYMKD